jgi:hypothetical protein
MRTPLRRPIAQVLKIARAGGRSLRQRICVGRLPLPARICSRPWPNHGHANMGLMTWFLPALPPNSGAIGLLYLAIGPPTRTNAGTCVLPDRARHSASHCRRHHLEANLRARPAGGPWVAGRGSCRGSIERRHSHIMLAIARDMRSPPCQAKTDVSAPAGRLHYAGCFCVKMAAGWLCR